MFFLHAYVFGYKHWLLIVITQTDYCANSSSSFRLAFLGLLIPEFNTVWLFLSWKGVAFLVPKAEWL